MNRKLISLIIVSVILTGGFYLWQYPVLQTAINPDWETYKNEKHGVIFKYPAELVLTVGNEDQIRLNDTRYPDDRSPVIFFTFDLEIESLDDYNSPEHCVEDFKFKERIVVNSNPVVICEFADDVNAEYLIDIPMPKKENSVLQIDLLIDVAHKDE